MRELNFNELMFIEALKRHRVAYLVIGSWSLRLHDVAINPNDIDFLIGTDSQNLQAFVGAWDATDPIPGRRVLTREACSSQMTTVRLGAGHADILTSIAGVDFSVALDRAKIVAIQTVHLPTLARQDLESHLLSSDRPGDRDRLELLRRVNPKTDLPPNRGR